MDSDYPLWGLVLLLFILIMAIVSSMKTALEYASESSIRKKAEGGSRKAVYLLKLIGYDTKGQYVLDLLLCSISVVAGLFSVNNILQRMDLVICRILVGVLIIFLMTLFGILLPKRLAIKHPENVIFKLYGFIRILSLIFWPAGWMLEKMISLVQKIFRTNPSNKAENEIEEEIISIVNEGHEQGVIDAGKAEMISNIIELDDKEVKDIMTHKKRIVAIDAEMSVEEALKIMLSENYSRYPLYVDNLDNIVGILHMKDVISAYISDGKKHTLQEIAREAFFVPETQSVNILFKEMQSKNIHMAIVVDEYGQTAGLVAMEDFLEEIVGNIQDEYDDNEEKMILAVDNNSYVVNGSISLEDLEEELDIVIDHEDFDTLNGLLISILDRIPEDGEKATLQYGGYQFDILETMNKMIGQVRISKLPVDMEASLDKTVYE